MIYNFKMACLNDGIKSVVGLLMNVNLDAGLDSKVWAQMPYGKAVHFFRFNCTLLN